MAIIIGHCLKLITAFKKLNERQNILIYKFKISVQISYLTSQRHLPDHDFAL